MANTKKVVRLAGFIFVLAENLEGSLAYHQLKNYHSRSNEKKNAGDPLAKTKEYMRNKGTLRQFLESLKPENRQQAGCM